MVRSIRLILRYLRKKPKLEWDPEILQDTVKTLEEIQLYEMRMTGYNPNGPRLSNEVRSDLVPESFVNTLFEKYDIPRDEVQGLFIRDSFLKLFWPYSRFESPFTLGALAPARVSINNYWQKYKLPLNKVIIMGTTPTGALMPRIKKTSKGGHIVLFNEGILTLIHCVAKATCLLTPTSTDPNSDELDVSDDVFDRNIEEAYGRFQEVVKEYIISRDATSSKVYLQEKKYLEFVTSIDSVAPGYIIAHEYSHFFLGHFGDYGSIIADFIRRFSGLPKSYVHEFSADRMALDIVLEGFEEIRDQKRKYLGVEFALNLSQVIQELTIGRPRKSHPTFEDRITQLRKRLRQRMPREEFKRVIAVANWQRSVFITLLEIFKNQNKDLIHPNSDL